MDFGLGSLLSFDNLNGPLQFGYDVYNTERNYQWQRKNYWYQKQLQKQIFEREDNAVQRRAADMRAAGFSPYLAAGNGANAGTVVSTATPQHDGVNFQSTYAASLAASQAKANIDRTKAEEQSIKDSAHLTRLNAQLTQKQLDWYDNHPQYAPGVESGVHTGKGFSSIFDDVSTRLGNAYRRWRDAPRSYDMSKLKESFR